MGAMVNVVIIPASPALVAALAPADAASEQVRTKAQECIAGALKESPKRPIEFVGSYSASWHTEHTGSFRAWGAPQTRVSEGNFLPELVARYLIENSAALEDYRECSFASTRDKLAEINASSLTIVAVDGSAGLTPKAPLALVEGSDEIDQWCREVLRGESPPARSVEQLSQGGIVEPGIWLELASIRPQSASLIEADTSLGVGRYIACWEVS